jgi:hypothetical protein
MIANPVIDKMNLLALNCSDFKAFFQRIQDIDQGFRISGLEVDAK